MAQVHDIDRYSTAPDARDLEALAREGLATIPMELRRVMSGLVIRIEEFPDEETLDDLDCDSAFELLGLYRGVHLARKSQFDQPDDVDTVYLYRRPILDYWCESGEMLADIVRHVLIHEIGHHFGFSDDDMERIEEQA